MTSVLPNTNLDPLGGVVFDSFFDFTTEDEPWITDAFKDFGLEGSYEAMKPEKANKLEKKRKSVDLETKFLENLQVSNDTSRGASPVKRKRGRPKKDHISLANAKTYSSLPTIPFEPLALSEELNDAEGTCPEDLKLLSDLFLTNEDIKPVSKQIMKSRKSEDWDSKPEDNRKRLKWSHEELKQLWEGISIHGNNWTEIRNMFTTRSYCQIKDKGRRCLFLLGWETGRSKHETDSSYKEAKRLAEQVLSRLK